jgi:hypothetical protein
MMQHIGKLVVVLTVSCCVSGASAQGASTNGSCVISGGTNFGTITQNCVINPLPPPIILLDKDFTVGAQADGSFNHAIKVRLTQTADLILAACGDQVVDVDASPYPAGMMASPDTAHQKNCILKRFQNAAAGKWVIVVKTSTKDSKFTLEPSLE